jgi:hypothetical protein
MAIKIVQNIQKIPLATAAIASTAITLKSGYLRVSTGSTGAYIAIGNNPTATQDSYHIPANNLDVFKERVARQRIAGVVTGTATTITFDGNSGNPFTTADYVSFENTTIVGLNTVHNSVTATTDSSLTVNFDSRSYSASGIAFTTGATVARSVKISALANGAAGEVNIVEVQIASQA